MASCDTGGDRPDRRESGSEQGQWERPQGVRAWIQGVHDRATRSDPEQEAGGWPHWMRALGRERADRGGPDPRPGQVWKSHLGPVLVGISRIPAPETDQRAHPPRTPTDPPNLTGAQEALLDEPGFAADKTPGDPRAQIGRVSAAPEQEAPIESGNQPAQETGPQGDPLSRIDEVLRNFHQQMDALSRRRDGSMDPDIEAIRAEGVGAIEAIWAGEDTGMQDVFREEDKK